MIHLKKEKLTILHVEDDVPLAELVKTAFARFGFQGEMINAESVSSAVNVLNERARNKEPLGLIITDMQLPDGTGLDVIREVRISPTWRMTPIIVLSNEVREGVINDAYALGANSYMPKSHAAMRPLESLRSLYSFWLENAMLPRTGPRDRLQEALERAMGLRTRTAEFYLNLANASQRESYEMGFWLDRALNEGNLANLLAFFRNKLKEGEVPQGIIDRFTNMQIKVKDALRTSEEQLKKTPAPGPALVYQWVLDLVDALDEEVFAEGIGYLFPKSAVATTALKARVATQFRELALHVLNRAKEEKLRQKAASLLDWSQRLMPDDRTKK